MAHVRHAIALDGVGLHRDMDRACMSTCIETRVMCHLFDAEMFAFGWCKTMPFYHYLITKGKMAREVCCN